MRPIVRVLGPALGLIFFTIAFAPTPVMAAAISISPECGAVRPSVDRIRELIAAGELRRARNLIDQMAADAAGKDACAFRPVLAGLRELLDALHAERDLAPVIEVGRAFDINNAGQKAAIVDDVLRQHAADLIADVLKRKPENKSSALLGKLAEPLPRFTQLADNPNCRTNESGGRVRALLIGIGDYKNPKLMKLTGPAKDLKLVKALLLGRKVQEEDILTLQDSDATRDRILEEWRTLVAKTECGDIVFLELSVEGALNLGQLPLGWAGALTAYDAGEIDAGDASGHIWGAELAEFVTAIRNKGASIAIIVDSNGAAGLALQHFQELARRPWRETSADASARGTAEPFPEVSRLRDKPGDYAIFYSANADEPARDVFFTPTIQSILLASTTATPNGVWQVLRGKVGSTPSPVVESSNPDMPLFEARRPFAPKELEVTILKPESLRAAVGYVDTKSFELIGSLPDANSVDFVEVNYKRAAFDKNTGQFKSYVDVVRGENDVVIAARFLDYSVATRSLKFNFGGDKKELAAKSTSYALLIANEHYQHEKDWTKLETPLRDIRDIAQILTTEYGFQTEYKVRGETRKLILEDRPLNELFEVMKGIERDLLTEHDRLLIYYAGHGQIEGKKDSEQGYWVPVEGETNSFNWLDQERLRRWVANLNAKHVLIVSDSCFSGVMALKRGPGIQDAKRTLDEYEKRKSRRFIASGGKQPVRDSGPEGHSIFASKFLQGLREMKFKRFSSKDLSQEFLQYVASAPLATGAEAQVPRNDPIGGVEDDGGDFVFSSIEAAGTGTPAD